MKLVSKPFTKGFLKNIGQVQYINEIMTGILIILVYFPTVQRVALTTEGKPIGAVLINARVSQ